MPKGKNTWSRQFAKLTNRSGPTAGSLDHIVATSASDQTEVPVKPSDSDQWEWDDRLQVCQREVEDCYTAIIDLGEDPALHQGYTQLCENASNFSKTSPGTPVSEEYFNKFSSYKNAIHAAWDASLKMKDCEWKLSTYRRKVAAFEDNRLVSENYSINQSYKGLCAAFSTLEKTELNTPEFDECARTCEGHIQWMTEELKGVANIRIYHSYHPRDDEFDDGTFVP